MTSSILFYKAWTEIRQMPKSMHKVSYLTWVAVWISLSSISIQFIPSYINPTFASIWKNCNTRSSIHGTQNHLCSCRRSMLVSLLFCPRRYLELLGELPRHSTAYSEKRTTNTRKTMLATLTVLLWRYIFCTLLGMAHLETLGRRGTSLGIL